MTRPVDFESKNWRELRRRILNRDNKKCYVCRKTDNITVHHIIPRREGGKSEPRNLITLCMSCHDKAEEAPDTWIWIQANRQSNCQKSSMKFNDNTPMPNVDLKQGQHISQDSLGKWRIWGRDYLGVYSVEIDHVFADSIKTTPIKSIT